MNIGVTAPPDGFKRYQIALESFGLHAIRTPSVKIKPSEETELARLRAAAEHADVIFLTSERAVAFLWPNGSMPAIDVAAVGASTARAATAAGGRVIHTGRSGAAAFLAEVGPRLRSSNVLFPRAAGAHPSTLAALKSTARSVVSGIVYTAVPIAPPTDQVDGVVFASPSAVEGWFLARDTNAISVAAIGPTTAAALAARGVQVDGTADTPSPAALAAAMAQVVEERTPR